jgi:hypothetical protein
MDLATLMPARSVEDILAERVRLSIGGEVYTLPSLSIEATEAWVARMDGEFVGLMTGLEKAGDDIPKIVTILTSRPDRLLALLLAYDLEHRLPPEEELRRKLTPMGLLRAIMEVWRAANPLADIALAGLTRAIEQNGSPLPTSSPPRPMAGRPRRSAES